MPERGWLRRALPEQGVRRTGQDNRRLNDRYLFHGSRHQARAENLSVDALNEK